MRYEKNVVCICALVDSFHVFFKRYISDHRGECPEVCLSIGGMLGYPDAVVILFSANNAVSLLKPFLNGEYFQCSQRRFDPGSYKIQNRRVSLKRSLS